jgi:hypothetical protein
VAGVGGQRVGAFPGRRIPPLTADAISSHTFLSFGPTSQYEFARKSGPRSQFPANPIAAISAISIDAQALQDISRTTRYTCRRPENCCSQPIAHRGTSSSKKEHRGTLSK